MLKKLFFKNSPVGSASTGQRDAGAPVVSEEIVAWIVRKCLEKYSCDLVKDSPQALNRIREESARIHRQLQTRDQVEISLPFLGTRKNSSGVVSPFHFLETIRKSDLKGSAD